MVTENDIGISPLLPLDADPAERRKVYKRRWNQKNVERQRKALEQWRSEHPEQVKKQRKQRTAARKASGLLPYHTEYGRSHRAQAMLYAAKYRAAKKGLDFSITAEDIYIPEFCPVFGMRLETSPDVGRSDASPSLDRINNKQGYIKGNVIVVSWLANRIKSDATVEQLRTVADFYDTRQSSSTDLRR